MVETFALDASFFISQNPLGCIVSKCERDPASSKALVILEYFLPSKLLANYIIQGRLLKISIITVSYNSASTIGDTLRSVSEQTHPDIEHLVIDGGSSDGTLEIVRLLGERVSCCLSEADRGIYDGMNKGLRLATGEFVGFLNADDVFSDPEAVSRMARFLETHAAGDVVYSDLVYVRSDNLQIVVRHWRSGRLSPGDLKMGWMPPHPTFYIRRSRLQDIGEFDTGLHIAADYDFMLRCLLRDDFSVLYLPCILVRMRSGGISNRSLRNIFHKSREDLSIIRRNKIGGLLTLIIKNIRKVGQFVMR